MGFMDLEVYDRFNREALWQVLRFDSVSDCFEKKRGLNVGKGWRMLHDRSEC